MNDFLLRIKSSLKRGDRGASAVEYALIVGLIAAILGGVIFALGQRVDWMFDRACDNVVASKDVTQCDDTRPQ
ncbi:Flp pilus assembly protein, pilin Flp [Micromonospora rhizosphaerae]|uniref:Flp pilus assembly protein, pilin Flp n=1 Tax=Micromonospora rhizosphaerae TaxID=568872 RepID=A0A1C6REE0_9ACTN|nr:Flp family type IVb pilin [Micromonospora rhizosphaerae]SCL15532.1 Flp pilus assembly protein, pilin Flp [Micromonospora rhizosphaerae]